jgi:uncharacterized small protein (DUF1192 family)
MMEEEAPARPKRLVPERPALEAHSIEDLRDYVAALREEIARVEARIAAKGSAREAADQVFRRPG